MQVQQNALVILQILLKQMAAFAFNNFPLLLLYIVTVFACWTLMMLMLMLMFAVYSMTVGISLFLSLVILYSDYAFLSCGL